VEDTHADSGASSPPRPGSTRERGRLGEEIAVAFLERRGLTVLARNLRSRLGEIDVLARDGPVLVFVEVKARRAGAADPPQVSVDARKQRRLARLALGYLAARGLGERPCRFDVIAVTLPVEDGTGATAPTRGGRGERAASRDATESVAPRVEHFPDAFTLGGWAG
jgi:putative endonuclease